MTCLKPGPFMTLFGGLRGQLGLPVFGGRPVSRALLFACAAVLIPLAAAAQAPATPASPDCGPTAQLKAPQIYGLWRVGFTGLSDGLPPVAMMLLERHAEFSESLAGFISRDLGAAAGNPKIAGHSAKARLAGDLEDGIFVLDESSDNISITGTWNGEVVAGSCARQIRGVWKDTSKSAPADAPDIPFTLTRSPG